MNVIAPWVWTFTSPASWWRVNGLRHEVKTWSGQHVVASASCTGIYSQTEIFRWGVLWPKISQKNPALSSYIYIYIYIMVAVCLKCQQLSLSVFQQANHRSDYTKSVFLLTWWHSIFFGSKLRTKKRAYQSLEHRFEPRFYFRLLVITFLPSSFLCFCLTFSFIYFYLWLWALLFIQVGTKIPVCFKTLQRSCTVSVWLVVIYWAW